MNQIKKIILISVFFYSPLQSQTFIGNLGSNSLNWNVDQKDFNSPPRDGVNPMSIKLWNNYQGAYAPSQFGSLLEINGLGNHLISQLYFDNNWNGGRILYRSAFYVETTWDTWRYLLDSKSDIESSGNLKIKGTGNHYIEYGNIGIGTTTPKGILQLVKLNSNLLFDLNTSGIVKIISKGWNANIDIHTFQIDGSENFNQVNLHPNGFVGIGTSSPTSMLTVAGNIHSREVKVSVEAGADFVFENNYHLTPLESIDKYIKENKHLPEIASANQMKKDGINLSEMNMALLKKIEELTLYLIEIKKDNIEMKKRLEKWKIS